MKVLNKVVRVGIADMNIVTEPDTIRTSGLGSCVGVVLYDEKENRRLASRHAAGFEPWQIR